MSEDSQPVDDGTKPFNLVTGDRLWVAGVKVVRRRRWWQLRRRSYWVVPPGVYEVRVTTQDV